MVAGGEHLWGRERLILLDVGELRTRAAGYDVTGGGLRPLGYLVMESAAAPGELPARAGARRGLDAAVVAGRREPPPVIGHPEGQAHAPLLVGAPAATLGGYEATLAGGASAAKVLAVLHAALFPFVRTGDRVHLVLVDGPSAVADRLRSGPGRWQEQPVVLRGFEPASGELQPRAVRCNARTLAAGELFLELMCARGWLSEAGPPALVLDLGHRTSRLYLLEASQGLLDLEIIPHGGVRLLEHARRYAAQRGWQTGGDVALLRQLAQGTEMLSFGGMSFVTRQFFTSPLEDLAKALAAGLAERLRRHGERGGRWPGALLVAGGGARTLAPMIGERLAARRLGIAEVRPLEEHPCPQLAGALAMLERLAAAPH
ncbi:MAG: hypothetical protein KatS3mg102_1088 [Planctomycetota bacterium]|nr:MAG: hypothetical protein KatS3mg102_1088 [Planctomycetota bacterium]